MNGKLVIKQGSRQQCYIRTKHNVNGLC